MIASDHGLVKQVIRKRLLVLYAKGILILVLCTPMLPVRSTQNACLNMASVISSIYFLTSHVLQVPEKLKQQKHNAEHELWKKQLPQMLPMQRSCDAWKWLTDISATIPAVTLLIYSDECLQTVKWLNNFYWENKMQIHDTKWNCFLLQIWIIEVGQFIAILFLSFNLNSLLQKCQMNVKIQFWSNENNMVANQYFDSQILERSNADDLCKSGWIRWSQILKLKWMVQMWIGLL